RLKKFQSRLIYISLSMIVASAVILLADTNIFRNSELTALHLLFQTRPARNVQPAAIKIIIVEVTQDDVQKFGRWPWPRTRIAQLIDALKELGAGEIFLDFLISGTTTAADDNALARAFKDAGNIYLPYVLYPNAPQKDLFPLESIGQYARGIGA